MEFIFGSEAGVFDVEVRTVTITAKKTDLFIMQPLSSVGSIPSNKLVLEEIIFIAALMYSAIIIPVRK